MRFQKKSEITVREAAKIAFRKMPDIFSAIEFCDKARVITGRFSLMDQTAMRRLREIRADSLEFNYRCFDNEKALYKKI